MVIRAIVPLVLAACGAATAVPERRDSSGMISFHIDHSTNTNSKLGRRATDTDVPLYNVSSVSYLIALSIGTPNQLVKVAIDTGSDELWVNPDCFSPTLTSTQSLECQNDGEYHPDDSTTSIRAKGNNTIPYGKGTVAIDYYADDIQLPNSSVTLKNVTFGVATDSMDLNEGILGLGFGKNILYPNFVDNLYTQNMTRSRAFSVALGSVNAKDGGVIIFGGVDTKKFHGKLAQLKNLGPQGRESVSRYWVNLDKIGGGGKADKYLNNPTPVVLDSGSSLSYLPASIVNQMASDLGGKLDRQSGLYLVDCKNRVNSKTFDFTFSGMTIQVPYNEFIWDVDGTNCVLGAEGTDSSSGITALLGDTFMRSAFIVFDQTSQSIFMAPYNDCGENQQAIGSAIGAAGNLTGECDAPAHSTNAGPKTTSSVSKVLLVAGGVAAVMSLL